MKQKILVAILPIVLSSCNAVILNKTVLDETIREEFTYNPEMLTYWNSDPTTCYFFNNIDKSMILDFNIEDDFLIGLYCEDDYYKTVLNKCLCANSDEIDKFQMMSRYITIDMHKEGFNSENVYFASINKADAFELCYKQYKLVSLFATRNVDIIIDNKKTKRNFIYESNYYVTSNSVKTMKPNPSINIKDGKYCYVDAPEYDSYIRDNKKLLTSGTNEFFFDFKNNALPITMYDNKECIKINVELYKNYKNYNEMEEIFNNAKIGEELVDDTKFTFLDVNKLN